MIIIKKHFFLVNYKVASTAPLFAVRSMGSRRFIILYVSSSFLAVYLVTKSITIFSPHSLNSLNIYIKKYKKNVFI